MNKNKHYLNGFILKVIAIITMTIDHIGLAAFDVMSEEMNTIMRVIGRLSLPLFAFAIVEGILHTRSKKNYLIRLGVETVFISMAIAFIDTQLNFATVDGNIFLDLVLGGTLVACLMLKDYKKLWSIIPIAITILLQFDMIPIYLRTSYSYYGISLIVGFYLTHLLSIEYARIIAPKYGLAHKDFCTTSAYRSIQNLMAFSALIIINLLFYFISSYIPVINERLNMSFQTYSMFAGAFLLFYNGRRGYNKKWFQYGCYIYYPLHLIIIFGIFALM